MNKIALIIILIVFSFIFVSIQTSIFLPPILEETNCECKPCSVIEERLGKYLVPNSNNAVSGKNSTLIFMGYCWLNTILIDIMIYKKISKYSEPLHGSNDKINFETSLENDTKPKGIKFY